VNRTYNLLDLVRRDDFVSDVDSLSLLGMADGFGLGNNGWIPAVVQSGALSVDEAITLLAYGASDDDLAANIQALTEKIKQISDSEDAAERYGVWLRTRLLNETGIRQAFLKRLEHRPGQPVRGSGSIQSYIGEYLLGLERMPYWESPEAETYETTAVNGIGGKFDYTTYGGSPGAVVGDEPARLALVKFRGVNGATYPFHRFWMGFKTNRHGNRANFQSTWSLRKGFAFGADTTGGTSNSDTTALDGYKAKCTFATVTTMFTRVKIRVQDVTANYTAQRGRYHVLLRAQMGAGLATQAMVRMGTGLSNDPNPAWRQRVPVAGNVWKFHDMGTITLPSPGNQYGGSNLLTSSTIFIGAELASGAAGVEFDCLVLIPADEGFVYAELQGAFSSADGVEYESADENPLYVMDRPAGQKTSIWMHAGIPEATGAPRINGGLPTGSGILVAAGEHWSFGSTKGDTFAVTMQVYNRWKELRGAE